MNKEDIKKRLEDIEKLDNNNIKFWDFVKEINFSNSNEHIELLQLKAINLCGNDIMLLYRLDEIFYEYQCLLYDVLTSYMIEKYGCEWSYKFLPISDDSRYYLESFIVGMGKKEYIRHLNHPRVVSKRAKEYNFEEGFSYVFNIDMYLQLQEQDSNYIPETDEMREFIKKIISKKIDIN